MFLMSCHPFFTFASLAYIKFSTHCSSVEFGLYPRAPWHLAGEQDGASCGSLPKALTVLQVHGSALQHEMKKRSNVYCTFFYTPVHFLFMCTDHALRTLEITRGVSFRCGVPQPHALLRNRPRAHTRMCINTHTRASPTLIS